MADTNRTYYVLCKDNCKFESLTREQIIQAIAEATGKTPTNIDDAFITKIKEQNKGGIIKVWRGTTAEYNAITKRDDDTVYIKTDDTRDADVDAAIKALGAELEFLQTRGIARKVDEGISIIMLADTTMTSVGFTRKNANAVAIPVITSVKDATGEAELELAVPLQINGDRLYAFNVNARNLMITVDIYEVGIYDGENTDGGEGIPEDVATITDVENMINEALGVIENGTY